MLTCSLFFLVDVFTGNAAVDHDFIRVDVETSSGETKSDVHMHVFPKKEVLERPAKPGGIPLNVALIMFDSTSAANFRRKMPNSLEYLTKNLDSLLMQGKTSYTLFSFNIRNHTIPQKIQPIRLQKCRCIFDGIEYNLPIMHRAYVALIVLAAAFSVAWFKILMQCSLVVYHGISHLCFLGIHTPKTLVCIPRKYQ